MGGWSSEYDDEDPEGVKVAQKAIANGILQSRRKDELILERLANPKVPLLTPEVLCELNRLAVDGLVDHPGQFRVEDVVLTGSIHEPPEWSKVPKHVENLCDEVSKDWVIDGDPDKAITMAAYVLWFVNWIHPFEDGNGRTARAASYIVLSVGIGHELMGELNVVERLVQQKIQYWRGLDDADKAYRQGKVDVSKLSALIRDLLEAQLADE